MSARLAALSDPPSSGVASGLIKTPSLTGEFHALNMSRVSSSMLDILVAAAAAAPPAKSEQHVVIAGGAQQLDTGAAATAIVF